MIELLFVMTAAFVAASVLRAWPGIRHRLQARAIRRRSKLARTIRRRSKLARTIRRRSTW